nr:MAG TPA: hypothetical protein [Caudoviricetes sp.]
MNRLVFAQKRIRTVARIRKIWRIKRADSCRFELQHCNFSCNTLQRVARCNPALLQHGIRTPPLGGALRCCSVAGPLLRCSQGSRGASGGMFKPESADFADWMNPRKHACLADQH